MPITPYLLFNGNCREAMNFYKECFGGRLEFLTFGDAPENVSEEGSRDQIMHACLSFGDFILMASDNPRGAPLIGDNVSLSISTETIEETEELFKALSRGGKVSLPLSETFWADLFGMVTDKYGFHWMFNCTLKK